MTDGIVTALATPVARSSPDRNALAGNDEQADFGRALASPDKGDQPAREPHPDTETPRDKRWLKLAEHLAARDPGVAMARDNTDETNPVAQNEQADDAEPPLADPSATGPASPDPSVNAPLPLLLALSELRKASSQPANAGPAAAPASEAGDFAEQPQLAGDASGTDHAKRSDGGTPARMAGATALPAGMSAMTEPQALAQPSPASDRVQGQASGDVDSVTDKQARPAPARQPDQPSAGRVSVISEQSIPAPATAGTNSTAGALALAIASDAPRHTAAASAVQQLQASATNAPAAHVLKIQLRPVELGMVTASLRLSGEQLSVEIEVENAEAYHRLSADREAINTALRGLGFDVDRITILQPQQATPAQARGDGGGASSAFGEREQPAFQSGGSDDQGANSGNERPGARPANEEANARNISSPRPEHPGNTRYI